MTDTLSSFLEFSPFVFLLLSVLVIYVSYRTPNRLRKQDNPTPTEYTPILINFRSGSAEELLLSLINNVREGAVYADSKCVTIARSNNSYNSLKVRSLDRKKRSEVLHNSSQETNSISATGYTSIKKVFSAWVDSPSHYRIIKDPTYLYCGISIITDKGGTTWYCVNFHKKTINQCSQ